MATRFIPNPNLKVNLEKHLAKSHQLAMELIASELDKYVPFKTGQLSMSAFNGGKRNKQYDKRNRLFVVWDSPYVVKQFFGEGYNFTRDKHPLARAYWTKSMTKSMAEKIMKAAVKRTQLGK